MKSHTSVRDRMIWLAPAVTSVLMACAETKVETVRQHQGAERLPKPDRVLVYNLAVATHEVSVNSAIGARIKSLATRTSKNEEQLKVGRAVANALSEELVKELHALGMPAQRSDVMESPRTGTLAIEGQFLTIDEGNRLRRLVIGFGAGGSEVRTQVQVSLGTPTGNLLLEEFTTDAESSKKPGTGPMAATGAAVTGTAAAAATLSGGVGVVTEFDQTVEGDARRTAHEIV
jgi:hypothetical protein